MQEESKSARRARLAERMDQLAREKPESAPRLKKLANVMRAGARMAADREKTSDRTVASKPSSPAPNGSPTGKSPKGK